MGVHQELPAVELLEERRKGALVAQEGEKPRWIVLLVEVGRLQENVEDGSDKRLLRVAFGHYFFETEWLDGHGRILSG